MLLESILPGLMMGAASELTVANPFDKIGFDLDVIGRQREIARITETTQLAYDKDSTQVNIAVWNMHVPESHHFEDILETALSPMGRGGGFRIVVFRGDGYLRNDGSLGLDNWRCSGNVVQDGRAATFEKFKEKSVSGSESYFYEMPGWLQWVL